MNSWRQRVDLAGCVARAGEFENDTGALRGFSVFPRERDRPMITFQLVLRMAAGFWPTSKLRGWPRSR